MFNPSVNLFIITMALLVSLALPTKAQENEDEVVRVRTDLVTVPTTVTDNHGRHIFDLTQADFGLRIDNKPVKVDFFSTGTAQVALAFLLDASGSARDYLLRQRETALSLFARFGPGSRVAVMPFNETLKVAATFTTSIETARAGFNFPAGANRQTAIIDSALSALRIFDEGVSLPGERKIVILTSDGLDTASLKTATEVIRRAREQGVSFYVIHFPIFSPIDGRLAPRPPVKGFRDLAEKTGGRYFMASNARDALAPAASYDLTPIFKAIEEDLASQYLLGFYPDETMRDGGLHRIKIEVAGRSRQRLHVSPLREDFTISKQ
jgi:Ca-activated chloride channel homolog